MSLSDLILFQEIGREFEKLIIGGNCKPSNQNTQNQNLGEGELVIDDETIENGFDENIDNIEIGESNEETIELFVNNNEVPEHHEEVTVVETDDIPPDIQVELFSKTSEIIEEVDADEDPPEETTDGNMFNVVRTKEPSIEPQHQNVTESTKPKVWKQTKIKLKVDDDCENVIENLPSLPDKTSAKEQSPKKSPKKESPVLEYRKPGRPRTKTDNANSRNPENGPTR